MIALAMDIVIKQREAVYVNPFGSKTLFEDRWWMERVIVVSVFFFIFLLIIPLITFT